MFDSKKLKSSSKGKVLIVDDDLIVLELYKEILEVEDYSVTALSDPEEALKLIKEEKFDAVVLDVYMPKIDGWELLNNIANIDHFKEVPVIMLTVTADKDLAYSHGITHFLTKPIDSKALVQLLDSYCTKSTPSSILSVDNYSPLSIVFEESFKNDGVIYHSVNNFDSAYKYLKNNNPQVILIDSRIGLVTCYDLIERIRFDEGMNKAVIYVFTDKHKYDKDMEIIGDKVDDIFIRGQYRVDKLIQNIKNLIH